MTNRLWIENDFLKVSATAAGAEVRDIIDKKTGVNYLWQGDPVFWNGQSPLLFPIIGRVWEDKIKVDGKEYHAAKHGFAKDADFKIIKHDKEEVWFELSSNTVTLKKIPFSFSLRVGYRISGKNHYGICKILRMRELCIKFKK